MEAYSFDRAVPSDIPALMELYRSLIGSPGCTWHDGYPDEETAREDIANGSLYVVRSGGGIVAAASATSHDELAHLPWRPEHPGELARIGVAKPHQRRGVGSLLLKNVLAAVRERGYGGAVMLVSKQNAAALALYHKHGFARVGEVLMYGHDFDCYELVFSREA